MRGPKAVGEGSLTVAEARTTDRDDEALIARLRAGDEQALGELYDRLGRRAFGLAYRVLQDAAAAEEAAREAFLAVWQQAERLDPKRGHLESLVLTVVHRCAIDLARARRLRTEPLGPLDEDVVDARASEIFGRALPALTLEAVVIALRSMSEGQRLAIELAFFEGLSVREIADRVGSPVETIKSRLRLGLGKLRLDLGVQTQARDA